jgi:uncharacterized OB-fold protein
MLSDLATVGPNAITRPFWEACARRELRLQRCAACGRFRQPPLPGCPHCGSAASDWPLLAGRGRVFSFTVVHHPAIPNLQGEVPYNVVVVELEGAPGARLISNLLDVAPGELRIGLEVEIAWDEPRPGLVLPRFRRARPSEAPR